MPDEFDYEDERDSLRAVMDHLGRLTTKDEAWAYLTSDEFSKALQEHYIHSASEDMKLKRAAYVLGMALLQSSLPLDAELRAARDYAVSLGEDRRVMFPTDSREKE